MEVWGIGYGVSSIKYGSVGYDGMGKIVVSKKPQVTSVCSTKSFCLKKLMFYLHRTSFKGPQTTILTTRTYSLLKL